MLSRMGKMKRGTFWHSHVPARRIACEGSTLSVGWSEYGQKLEAAAVAQNYVHYVSRTLFFLLSVLCPLNCGYGAILSRLTI
jgi:hypothetical protein